MGLALARHIIEQHGGHIAVHSDADRNRFVVQLPLNADNGAEKG
jgi:nitrogen-specific signal transduction histidine kinase